MIHQESDGSPFIYSYGLSSPLYPSKNITNQPPYLYLSTENELSCVCTVAQRHVEASFFRKARNNEQRDEPFVIFNSAEFVTNEYMNIYIYAIFTFTHE